MPKPVRDHLGLAAGDRLRFSIEPDGRVLVEAATVRLRDLAGMLPRAATPVSLEAMDEAIHRGAVERALGKGRKERGQGRRHP